MTPGLTASYSTLQVSIKGKMKVEPAPLIVIPCAKDSVDILVAKIPVTSITTVKPAQNVFKILSFTFILMVWNNY
jgi:hypothetical protein